MHSASYNGTHLLLDIAQIRNTELLNDMAALSLLMECMVLQLGYKILDKIEHQFSPQGCTILFLLAESHFSIHTYPEHHRVAIDLYTCNGSEDLDVIAERLNQQLRGKIRLLWILPR